jgi:hypothetical protein
MLKLSDYITRIGLAASDSGEAFSFAECAF